MKTAGGELAITERTIVDELITRCPAAARVLVARRMQCVGCPLARFTSVADACRTFRQPLGSVLRELNACCSRCREPDTQYASGQVSGHISKERGYGVSIRGPAAPTTTVSSTRTPQAPV